MFVIRAEIHKMLVKIANMEGPDQTASKELVWICTVCLDLFCSHLIFEILKHLPYPLKLCPFDNAITVVKFDGGKAM